MRLSLLVCILFTTFTACIGQELSGKWEGNYGYNILVTRPQKIIFNIDVYNDTIISGSTHLYYNNDKYEHYTVSGVYHPKDSTIVFREDSTLGVKLGLGVDNVLGTYTMKLRTLDTVMRFEGKWRQNDAEFSLMNSKVWMEKPIPRVQKIVAVPAVKKEDKNLQRVVNVQQLIELGEDELDSIKVEIMDNAEVDGDIISLYYNDSLVIDRRPIAREPLVVYLTVAKKDAVAKLMLAAENQGKTPPCTAYMVVTTGKKKHELNLWSDFQKNGVLEFSVK